MKWILKVVVGSRAHGLNTETSDFDYRGVYIEPTVDFFRLDGRKTKDTYWVEGDAHHDKAGSKIDDTAWELGHFLHLSIQCNPTILEVYRAPIMLETPEGVELRNLFPTIWHPKRVHDSFLGYAANQRKKFFGEMSESVNDRFKKYATAYLRVLIQGVVLLEQKALITSFKFHEEFQTLLMIRNGLLTSGQIIDKCLLWEQKLHEMEKLCDQKPDLSVASEFLIKMRKQHWDTADE